MDSTSNNEAEFLSLKREVADVTRWWYFYSCFPLYLSIIINTSFLFLSLELLLISPGISWLNYGRLHSKMKVETLDPKVYLSLRISTDEWQAVLWKSTMYKTSWLVKVYKRTVGQDSVLGHWKIGRTVYLPGPQMNVTVSRPLCIFGCGSSLERCSEDLRECSGSIS